MLYLILTKYYVPHEQIIKEFVEVFSCSKRFQNSYITKTKLTVSKTARRHLFHLILHLFPGLAVQPIVADHVAQC